MDDRPAEPSLREVMGRYPTGVTVVAGRASDGSPFGLTVNSFTSVSLDPPLILVCIGHSSSSHDKLVGSRRFAVNLLSGEQEGVAMRFASEPSNGRFEDVPWRWSESGVPLLDGAVAWLDCQLSEVLRGGDHSILLGRVVEAGARDGASLLFHQGRLRPVD